MNRPRLIRGLRIGWSVAWALPFLLIALWLHTLRDQVRGGAWLSNSHYVQFVTFRHWMEVDAASNEIDAPRPWYPRATFQDNYVDKPRPLTSPVHRWQSLLYSRPDSSGITLTAPFWFPVLVTASFAILPWAASLSRLRRFSLRTLLIATTLEWR